MNLKISKQTLNLIIDELNKTSQDDYTTIENVLKLCPKKVNVSFAHQSCLTIKHLIKNEDSIEALEAVELYLRDGTPVPQDVYYAARAAASATASAACAAVSAASAAYYATSAANAVSAASAAYYATSAASAAAYAAASAADLSRQKVRAEKLRELLLLLKDVILENFEEDCRSELLELAI